MNFEILLGICLGVGLAASTGFRVFVPLFAMSLAAHFGVLPLGENWQWLGSTTALVILGVASLVESVSYLVPIVDNFLDAIAVPLAGLAGTIVMASSLTELSPAMTWALAIVAGGGAATAVKTTSAATRAVSTATTAGTANPAIGLAETGTAIGLSVLSIFAPVAAAVVVVIGLLVLIWLAMKLKKQLAK
ncbi:DUF4126 domain-containing protein [Moraxella nasibovis]|uniref:DUF4126 domain-containing protein n=1 Tax=Moraxella nasibovis TaxID=2904120 RepID=UPI00240F626D|nr:DUF4126 domain-containing protein [Moraxella nasibovis]WFF38901.1 DUF4126 domain-containing protein [Moraxella nasibovis]